VIPTEWWLAAYIAVATEIGVVIVNG